MKKIKVIWLLIITILLSFSSLLVSCSKANNDVHDNLKIVAKKPFYNEKEITKLKGSLDGITENSSTVSKALILNQEHNLNPTVVLSDYLNFDRNYRLKEQVKKSFARDIWEDGNLTELFANPQLKDQLINGELAEINPFEENKSQNSILMLLKLILMYSADVINKKDTLSESDFIASFLNKDVSKTIKDYQNSNYNKISFLIKDLLKTHNKMINNQSYEAALKWSEANLKKLFLKMGQNEVISDNNVNEINTKYQDMIKKFINLSLTMDLTNILSEAEVFSVDPLTDQTILTNFKKNIKDIENIAQLVVFSLPVVSYFLDTFDKINFNVNDIWYKEKEVPNSIKTVIFNQLRNKYLGFVKINNLKDIGYKLNKILRLDDSGLAFRKLLLISYLTPPIKELFRSIELTNLKIYGNRQALEIAALNGTKFGIFGLVKIDNIFNKMFNRLKPVIDKPLTNFKEKYITKIPDFDLNFNELLMILEQLLAKLNSFLTEDNINELADKDDFIENFKKIMEATDEATGIIPFSDILAKVNDFSLLKLGLDLLISERTGYISKIIKKNQDQIETKYVNTYFNDSFWNIENKKLGFLEKKILISYDISYQEAKKYHLEYEFEGIRGKLKLAAFEKISNQTSPPCF